MITIPLEWRRWTVLVAAIWIQTFTGTNFDFPSYSTQLKSVLEITQLQLNYLSMASDFGKLFGWCSGVLLLYLPAWIVLFMAAFLGLFGYGLQWLLVQRLVSLPYLAVFILCLSAGCSITWFNTISFVLCIKNFPNNWPLAVSLTVSFNGLTSSLYNLIATKITTHNTNSPYLILNAILPFIVSILALLPIAQQNDLKLDEKNDMYTFAFLYILATITGLYLFILDTPSQNIFIVAMLLLLPLVSPKMTQMINRYEMIKARVERLSYNLIEMNNYEELREEGSGENKVCGGSFFSKMIEKYRLRVVGEEHSAKLLVTRFDFWLYYVAYFCGGTIGLVYSNNLGQIAQSYGYVYKTEALVTIYSTCSFFGRLVSAIPDLVACFYPLETYTKRHITRIGWLTLSLVPLPIAFVVLILSGTRAESSLSTATGLIGVSSGFVFSAAVSITSELFGRKSSGINHNILITNIPLGSLLYGVLGGAVYDKHVESLGSNTCMGRKCYNETFIWWGCFCVLGFASSFLLFLRTKPAYREENVSQRKQILLYAIP